MTETRTTKRTGTARLRKAPDANRGAPATIRVAIYTRKSVSEGLEQQFNTLDAQRDAVEAYVRSQRGQGWTALSNSYDDGGFTGANIERPAFQRLLVDVEAGKVDVVAVCKIDRLSRSLLDFAKLMEFFQALGVAFVSVTETFDTSTPIGRMVLNLLATFAQFERETTAQRTRDKVLFCGISMILVTHFGAHGRTQGAWTAAQGGWRAQGRDDSHSHRSWRPKTHRGSCRPSRYGTIGVGTTRPHKLFEGNEIGCGALGSRTRQGWV